MPNLYSNLTGRWYGRKVGREDYLLILLALLVAGFLIVGALVLNAQEHLQFVLNNYQKMCIIP